MLGNSSRKEPVLWEPKRMLNTEGLHPATETPSLHTGHRAGHLYHACSVVRGLEGPMFDAKRGLLLKSDVPCHIRDFYPQMSAVNKAVAKVSTC